MKAFEVTSITNFSVAGEALLAAGFVLGRTQVAISARSLWAVALLLFAIGFMIGGIDHGFFEPKGNTRSRLIVQKVSWFCGGLTTYLIEVSTAYEFTSVRVKMIVALIGAVQLLIFLVLATKNHEYLIVMINYFPALLFLLICNICALGSGVGSWYMIAGIAVTIGASLVELVGVDRFSPVDRHGVYHLVMAVAVALFFLGGLALKG